MNVFLDALSDAWSQMTGTLAYVAQAFGENWRTGLAALLARPAALFYVVGIVAVLALALSGRTVGNRVGYRRGPFLSPNEKIFLRTLDAALGRTYRAFAQVRLAEIANPADSANVHLRRRVLNAVMAESVDFMICDVLTLDPVAVIEVDDRSHDPPERRDRDAFVNAVFAEIGLPLLRVKAQRTYSVAEFRDLFARVDLSVGLAAGRNAKKTLLIVVKPLDVVGYAAMASLPYGAIASWSFAHRRMHARPRASSSSIAGMPE